MSEEFELDVNSMHAALEAVDHVREVFESCHSSDGLTRKMLAERIGRDPAYVSRILNGRMTNVNYQTLARLILAMDRWPTFESTPLSGFDHGNNYCHRLEVMDDDGFGTFGGVWDVDVHAAEPKESRTENLSGLKVSHGR